MATFCNRSGKWQALVQVKGHAAQSKTFINKVDAAWRQSRLYSLKVTSKSSDSKAKYGEPNSTKDCTA